MTNILNEIQGYFAKKATEKAKIKKVTVNGKPATVTFKEYKATAEQQEEFKRINESGHYFYIIITTKTDFINTYYGKKETVSEIYITTKQEGNEIYKQLKATKKLKI